MSAQSKDVICSFSSKGRDDYNRLLLRLIDSVKEHWKGDMLVYSPDHSLSEYKGVTIHKGWPQPKGVKSFTHAEMPYQFKTAIIQEAVERGYERIIWLDSSMQLKKDLTPLFDSITGVTTFENLGHPTWKYLSDSAAELLRVPSEEWLLSVPQIWGGAFALNFSKEYARRWFEELKIASVNGSFKDGPSKRVEFVAHRHDQAVMSVMLGYEIHLKFDGQDQKNLKYDYKDMLPYGQILCPPHDKTGEYGTDPYLVCRGL